MNKAQVLQEVERWPLDEQIELLHALWDRLDIGSEAELPDDLKAELDRRVADMEAHPENTLTWEEVVKQVKGLQ